MILALLTATALAGNYQEGVTALKERRLDEAVTLLQRAANTHADPTPALWELGWAHWARGEYGEAEATWKRVKALSPDHPEVDRWLAAASKRAILERAPPPPETIETTATGSRRIRFAAAGDTMMGSDIDKGPAGLPEDDGAELFTGLAPLFEAAGIAFLNLEGTLADGLPGTKCGPDSSNCYAFRTPTRIAPRLKELGIDVVSLANNHAMDLGPSGQQATMDALDAQGIAHAGRFGDVAMLEHDGLRIAVVAAATSSCCLDVNQVDDVVRAITLADVEADLVVLSFHGGAEGSGARQIPGGVEIAWGERRGDVHKLARAAVDAGADLVLGHGPHVLRRMEVYRGRLIAYSLGNFCGYNQFGTMGGPTGTSVILEATVADNGVLVEAWLHPVALDDLGRPRRDPSGLGIDHIRELSGPDPRFVPLDVSEDGVLSW